MQSIRVEITQVPTEARWQCVATIGDRDVSDHLSDIRMIAFRGYLPSEYRNYSRIGMQRNQTLFNFLLSYQDHRTPLPPQILADAIRAYLTEVAPELTQGEGHTSQIDIDMDISENLAAAQPMLLSAGGKLFRLSPVAQSTGPTKMLDRLRAQAVAAINTQRTALLAQATREAAIIRGQATAERAQLEQDRVAFRREQGERFVIPAWLGSTPVIRRGDRVIAARVKFTFGPGKFTWPNWERHDGFDDDERPINPEVVDLEWTAAPASPFHTRMWVPFSIVDGVWELGSAYMDPMVSQLPHAAYSSFCCQPQGLPERIRSMADLETIARCVSRAFSVVNLSSLLTLEDSWKPEVQAFITPNVRAFITAWRNGSIRHGNVDAFLPRVTPVETATTVWTAGRTR